MYIQYNYQINTLPVNPLNPSYDLSYDFLSIFHGSDDPTIRAIPGVDLRMVPWRCNLAPTNDDEVDINNKNPLFWYSSLFLKSKKHVLNLKASESNDQMVSRLRGMYKTYQLFSRMLCFEAKVIFQIWPRLMSLLILIAFNCHLQYLQPIAVTNSICLFAALSPSCSCCSDFLLSYNSQQQKKVQIVGKVWTSLKESSRWVLNNPNTHYIED